MKRKIDLDYLLKTLKETTENLELYLNSAESVACNDFAKKYIEENKLEYIAEEVIDAIRAGFRYALQQNTNGFFKRLEK